MEASVQAEVQDAIEFAEQAPEPELDELYSDVYAPLPPSPLSENLGEGGRG
jgi:TPP-dependent pyruvate/acetoin dehydrogenase alpha subunit